MLPLAAATDPRWAGAASRNLPELLVDHAHCEKKAAGAALGLLFRHPEHRFLQEPLTALAREELAHFAEVLSHLDRLGIPYGPQHPGPYASRLHAAARRGEPERLMDRLLCCALIEARSCERLSLLAEVLPDAGLVGLYRGLHAAESRHHGLYVGLAEQLAGRDAARARLAELAAHEAEVLRAAPPLFRLHAGIPAPR